jgi:hypothetical protein
MNRQRLLQATLVYLVGVVLALLATLVLYEKLGLAFLHFGMGMQLLLLVLAARQLQRSYPDEPWYELTQVLVALVYALCSIAFGLLAFLAVRSL